MTSNLDRLLGALDAAGMAPAADGRLWRAVCPAHDHRDAVVTVRAGGASGVQIKCSERGCGAGAVMGWFRSREPQTEEDDDGEGEGDGEGESGAGEGVVVDALDRFRGKPTLGAIRGTAKPPPDRQKRASKPPNGDPGPVPPDGPLGGLDGGHGDPGPVPPPEEQAAEALDAAAERIEAEEADLLRRNRHYQVIGFVGANVAIRTCDGEVLFKQRETLCRRDSLLVLAPHVWWRRFLHNKGTAFGPGEAAQVGDELLRTAERIGQVDLRHMTGKGAARTRDGEVVYHLGDRVLAGGEEVGLDARADGMIYVADPRVELAESADVATMRGFASAVMGYRWAEPEDGRRFLGWLAVSLMGGALQWRPHIVMNAPAAWGKSWLLKNVVDPLLGDLIIRAANVSEAALARLTARWPLPVVIDEAEPTDKWVTDVLEVLRVASGGDGARYRADSTSTGVVTQSFRFCALLSATAAPLMGKANASRLSEVRFGPPVPDWPKVRDSIVALAPTMDRVRARIIRSGPEIVECAAEAARALEDGGVESREAMISGALSAGWAVWGVDDQVVTAGTPTEKVSDAADCLLDILGVRVRWDGGERSVLRLLNSVDDQGRRRAEDLVGVRRVGRGLQVHTTHPGLVGELRRGRWEGVDLRKLLLQLDGAAMSPNPQRVGGHRTRVVTVSAAGLERVGVVLDGGGPDPDEEI